MRFSAIGILVGVTMLIGCASQTNTITTTLDENGKPSTLVYSLSDEAMHYKVQADLAANRQPIVKLDLDDQGKVKGLMVYGSETQNIKQYQPAWERVLNQWGPTLFSAGLGAYGFNQMGELGKAGINGARGNSSVVNTSGAGSGVNVSGGNGGATTTTVSPTTTTTTTSTSTIAEP